MKTRRSPRNQERLFKLLGQEDRRKALSVAARTRCFDCTFYPKGGRYRGACTLHQEIVHGLDERACFKERRKSAHIDKPFIRR